MSKRAITYNAVYLCRIEDNSYFAIDDEGMGIHRFDSGEPLENMIEFACQYYPMVNVVYTMKSDSRYFTYGQFQSLRVQFKTDPEASRKRIESYFKQYLLNYTSPLYKPKKLKYRKKSKKSSKKTLRRETITPKTPKRIKI